MRKPKPEPKAYEVITTFYHNGVKTPFLDRYMVISTSASRAVSLVTLKEQESVVEAKELHHKVIVDKKR